MSTEVREYSRFLYRKGDRTMGKILHVYADELGDMGPFDRKSPIYLVSMVFLDNEADRDKGLSAFRKAERTFGEGTFVHVGNLIR